MTSLGHQDMTMQEGDMTPPGLKTPLNRFPMKCNWKI